MSDSDSDRQPEYVERPERETVLRHGRFLPNRGLNLSVSSDESSSSSPAKSYSRNYSYDTDSHVEDNEGSVPEEASSADDPFVQMLEKESSIANRYTMEDEEFRREIENTRLTQPILLNWGGEGRYDGQRRDSRQNDNRKRRYDDDRSSSSSSHHHPRESHPSQQQRRRYD